MGSDLSKKIGHPWAWYNNGRVRNREQTRKGVCQTQIREMQRERLRMEGKPRPEWGGRDKRGLELKVADGRDLLPHRRNMATSH